MSGMENLIRQGYRHFISGGSQGTDMQKTKALHRSMGGSQ